MPRKKKTQTDATPTDPTVPNGSDSFSLEGYLKKGAAVLDEEESIVETPEPEPPPVEQPEEAEEPESEAPEFTDEETAPEELERPEPADAETKPEPKPVEEAVGPEAEETAPEEQPAPPPPIDADFAGKRAQFEQQAVSIARQHNALLDQIKQLEQQRQSLVENGEPTYRLDRHLFKLEDQREALQGQWREVQNTAERVDGLASDWKNDVASMPELAPLQAAYTDLYLNGSLGQLAKISPAVALAALRERQKEIESGGAKGKGLFANVPKTGTPEKKAEAGGNGRKPQPKTLGPANPGKMSRRLPATNAKKQVISSEDNAKLQRYGAKGLSNIMSRMSAKKSK